MDPFDALNIWYVWKFSSTVPLLWWNSDHTNSVPKNMDYLVGKNTFTLTSLSQLLYNCWQLFWNKYATVFTRVVAFCRFASKRSPFNGILNFANRINCHGTMLEKFGSCRTTGMQFTQHKFSTSSRASSPKTCSICASPSLSQNSYYCLNRSVFS